MVTQHWDQRHPDHGLASHLVYDACFVAGLRNYRPALGAAFRPRKVVFATSMTETIEAFETLRSEGMISTWGLSNYDGAGLEEAVRHGQPALLQNSFSLLDRADEQDVLPFCAAHGIAYVPFGPLAGGWLTGKYRRGEPYPEGSRMTLRPGPYERLADDRVFGGLDKLREEAGARGVDLPTLAFAWVLARVDGAVCGPNRAEQLDPILAARELSLSSDDVDRIGGLFG